LTGEWDPDPKLTISDPQHCVIDWKLGSGSDYQDISDPNPDPVQTKVSNPDPQHCVGQCCGSGSASFCRIRIRTEAHGSGSATLVTGTFPDLKGSEIK